MILISGIFLSHQVSVKHLEGAPGRGKRGCALLTWAFNSARLRSRQTQQQIQNDLHLSMPNSRVTQVFPLLCK